MICPRIAARIKQHRDAPGEGIYAGKVRPFVPVAMHTGEREVFQVGDSAMLAWNDVIDVESGWIQVEGIWQYSHRFPARRQTCRTKAAFTTWIAQPHARKELVELWTA